MNLFTWDPFQIGIYVETVDPEVFSVSESDVAEACSPPQAQSFSLSAPRHEAETGSVSTDC